MTYGTASLIVAILCLATPQLTIAEDSNDLHPNLESGFSLDLGLFYPDRQLDLRVNGSLIGINDEIHFDEEVRLDRVTTFLRPNWPGDITASGQSSVNTSNQMTLPRLCSKRTSNGETSYSVRAAMRRFLDIMPPLDTWIRRASWNFEFTPKPTYYL